MQTLPSSPRKVKGAVCECEKARARDSMAFILSRRDSQNMRLPVFMTVDILYRKMRLDDGQTFETSSNQKSKIKEQKNQKTKNSFQWYSDDG
jgi:hypothetical protein